MVGWSRSVVRLRMFQTLAGLQRLEKRAGPPGLMQNPFLHVAVLFGAVLILWLIVQGSSLGGHASKAIAVHVPRFDSRGPLSHARLYQR